MSRPLRRGALAAVSACALASAAVGVAHGATPEPHRAAL